jgi:hypothetical protein
LTATTRDEAKSFLTLGWLVTPTIHPSYWINERAKPGLQTEGDVIAVPAESMASHTVVIAKSGSGKSFFLGRIIEELMIHTKARCLILDSNADFRKVYEVEDAKLWTSAKYDLMKGTGKLPTETSRKAFSSLWSTVSVKVLTAESSDDPHCEEFKLWWPSLSAEFLAENLNSLQSSELRQCHEFVKMIISLSRTKDKATKFTDNLNDAERLLNQRHQSGINLQELLTKEFRDPVSTRYQEELKDAKGRKRRQVERRLILAQKSVERRIRLAVEASKYVNDDIVTFYFSRTRGYLASGVIADARPQYADNARLTVIDLPSLRDKILAVNAVLATEWEEAREKWSAALEEPTEEDKRVPTFIVVDEAHNLIPAKTNGRLQAKLRDQFRMIAAEGRKYGLFLILVSQRPDKLDPFVISECDNKAVMQLDSQVVLNSTKDSLGLEDVGSLSKTLTFGTGRVLIIGRWSPEPRVLYCAARRTREGGRNLRAPYWASSYPAS